MKKLGLALLSTLFLNSCSFNLTFIHMKNVNDVKKIFADEKYQVEVSTSNTDLFDNEFASLIQSGVMSTEQLNQVKDKQKKDIDIVSIETETGHATVYVFSSIEIAESMFNMLKTQIYMYSCFYANTYCKGTEDLAMYYFEEIKK